MNNNTIMLPGAGYDIEIDSCGDVELFYTGVDDFGQSLSSIYLSLGDLEFMVTEAKKYQKKKTEPNVEELLEAIEGVTTCLVLESMKIPGFTKRHIELLAKVHQEMENSDSDLIFKNNA